MKMHNMLLGTGSPADHGSYTPMAGPGLLKNKQTQEVIDSSLWKTLITWL